MSVTEKMGGSCEERMLNVERGITWSFTKSGTEGILVTQLALVELNCFLRCLVNGQ